ncbi:MAG: PAS domain S-box protein [Balneolaceae bacterium]
MDSKLKNQISEKLKQCSKDEASFSKLEELFGELMEKHKNVNEQLLLLEQATKQDYDSILITELSLEEPGPKIVYVNEGFTKMTGYEKSEVLGKSPRILQGEKTEKEVLNKLKRRLKKGHPFFGHTVNYKKDGSEFINQWDIHPLTNSKGEVTHWVAYQRDITDRKEPGRLFFDSDTDFENLYEESKKTFVDLDARGNIIASNNSFKELIGYDAGELNDIKIWDLISDKDQKEVEYLFSDFDSKTTEDKTYVWEFKNKAGEKIKLECNIHFFLSNGETIVRMHLVNYTLRNRVIETLKKKKKHMENILATKDEFSFRFIKQNDGSIDCKYVSENFASVTGFNPEVILEKGVSEVLHKTDISEAEEALKRAFQGESLTIHCKYKTSEGSFIPVLQSFRPEKENSTESVESVKSVAMIEMEAK